MKLNKMMAVLAAGVAMVVTASVGYATGYYGYGGVTNLPLSFSGTLYLNQNSEYSTNSNTYTTNVVKRGGNLQNRGGSTTVNISQVGNHGFGSANFTVSTFNTYNYVTALNSDPLFLAANAGAAPTNSQLAYNLYTGQFWLIASNYAFNLSTNKWTYSWTNIDYSLQNGYPGWNTNIFVISTTFASPKSAFETLVDNESDAFGSISTNYYKNYYGPYENNTSGNLIRDFTAEYGADSYRYSVLAGYTGSLGNKISQSFSGASGQTNLQVGEIYLSTGTNLQFALTGFSVITESRTMATNTLADFSYNSFPAVSTATFSATLNGVVSHIIQPNSWTTNNFMTSIVTPFAAFVGTATGSQTANGTFLYDY